MALTYTKDIVDFNRKVKEAADVTELEITVGQLSASMLEAQGDIGTLATAVEGLEGDITTINNNISSLPTSWSTSETLYTNTGIVVTGIINEKLGLAEISIRGSATAPTQTSYSIQIDSKYIPIGRPLAICSNGASLYFNDPDNNLSIANVSTSNPWFSGSMLYALKRP